MNTSPCWISLWAFAPHAGGVLGEALVAPLGSWLVLLLGDTLNSLSGSITLWLWASALSVGVAGFTLALMSASWFGLFIKAIVFALVVNYQQLRLKLNTSG
mgnify:CR=1 FL=1